MVLMIPDEMRRLRAVNRLTTVMHSALLDAVCEIGARGARADLAFCTLLDDQMHRVVGAYGTDVEAFPRLPELAQGRRALVMVGDMASAAAMAAHPMVDGRLERMEAAVLAAVMHDGEAVGMIGVGWRRAMAAFPADAAAIVRRMVPVAEAQIEAEAVLTRMAQDAFRLLERVRG